MGAGCSGGDSKKKGGKKYEPDGTEPEEKPKAKHNNREGAHEST